MALKTDYVDDELAVSMGGKRQFNIVDSNGNILYENVHIEDTSKYSTVGDDFGAEDINATNEAVNNLVKDVIASQIGSGTTSATIDISEKASICCITKKSGVIVETKEIPTSVLESGDVVLLGNTSPVIGTDNIPNNVTLDNALLGKKIYKFQSQTSGSTPYGAIRGVTETGENIPNTIGTYGIGLSTDLSQSTGASITYNGLNSFTITVTDSTLSVYLCA